MIAKDSFKTSEHWYTRSGDPAYTVKGSNGTRSTTLKDARKLNLVPSVTSILNVAAKPALEIWKQRQLLLAALTLPKIDSESEDEYIDRIIRDSKEEGKAAADAGTEIHASIEAFYKGETIGHLTHVKATVDALLREFGRQSWVAEKSFAHELGFGGKCDLHCPDAVVDIKTKEFGDPSKVEAYDEHIMQLAAYRMGLGVPEARCANVFVSRSVPGLVKVIEHSQEDIQKGWEMFTHLLNYWQLSKGYK